MTNQDYLRRCLFLAQKAIGNTYPNPMVGAVIVYEDRIIGEGYHQKAGEAHAEINAINSVKKEEQSLLAESTIYVSLEPCAHHGKTPPCAVKLKEIGFKKVIIGTTDSHDKVDGKGINILKYAQIEVEIGCLEQESIALNKRFFTFHQKKRPYITLKWAESNDAFIDKDFQPHQISNPLFKQLVHKMRREEHAILVGKNTALHDNPTLTVRELDGKNPVRILIDLNLDIPQDFNLYNEEAQTLVFNTLKDAEFGTTKLIKISKDNWITDLMQHLVTLDIQSILVEGGSYTLNAFIQNRLWDEIFIIKNKNLNLLNGTKAPTISAIPQSEHDFRDNSLQHFINPNNQFIY